MGIRIDDLPPTISPNLGHEVPAMLGGLTVRLTLAQILGLVPGEPIDDRVAALIVNSGLLTKSYNDGADTLTLGVPKSTNAQAIAGTDDATAMTPLRVKDAIGALSAITKGYVSTPQTITSGGGITLGHSMGLQPKFVAFSLNCVTAELGFAVGDVVHVPLSCYDGTRVRGATVVATTTSLVLRFSDAASVFQIPRKDTGAVAGLTNASWTLNVGALA